MVLIRQPTDRVWEALQNELSAIAAFMPAIDSIRCIEKAEGAGVVQTVHEWKAAAGLPRAIEIRAGSEALTWIETAEWEQSAAEVRWSVESQLLGKSLTGSGVTRFERAMGGQGTRASFELAARMENGALGPLSELKWTGGLAEAATAVLAKTLQDLFSAAEVYLRTAKPNGGVSARGNAPEQGSRGRKQ